MKGNGFTRRFEIPKESPYADYSVGQLVAYLTVHYPNGSIERLKELYHKRQIGYVLYSQTNRILEGLNYVKGEANN